MESWEDYVQIDFDEILKESERAILIRIDDVEIWIPKSLCDEREDNWATVKEWFAIKEGLV